MQELEDEKQKETASGPWKLTAADKSDNESEADGESPVEPESGVGAAPASSQASSQPATKYVPPHLRNPQPTQTSISPVALSSTRRTKTGAPKIGDIVEFPSLGPADTSEDSKGYQTVRHGIRDSSPNRKSPNVTLDNKYGLLQNND